jgi:BirA family transcriptional regulator, biotin operon repressor / biotin---[acetyl-CoA-carboxylase] ligase
MYDTWLGQPVDHWRRTWGVPLLQVHGRVGSTNDLARDLAGQGAPAGTTIIAEAQDRGRGRRGREWIAPQGSSLLLSMIFRPSSPGAETLLSIRLGLAAASAIEGATPVRILLKWPNDLMIGMRKVSGILCEGAREDRRSLHMVAGIGINIFQADPDWPDHLRDHATSLEAASGHTVDMGHLASLLVARWLDTARLGSATLSDPELESFRSRDALFGQPIYVNGRHAGTGHGIDADGALRAGTAHQPRRIIAGTVRTTPDLQPERP